jgi:hypothetical protein
MLIQLHKKNGCIIEFECDLTDAEARRIVIDADRANQNVGDFALQLATQRRGLSPAQSGWLRYLAMEIDGRLRLQILAGPWAWLLSQATYETEQIRIITPPPIDVDPGQTAELDPVCRWVFVKRRWALAVNVTSEPQPAEFGSLLEQAPNDANMWFYVGLVDSLGGFYFSKKLTQIISGEGRQSMAVMFPTEEQQLQDEAKWLQWRTNQLMEALKRSNPV